MTDTGKITLTFNLGPDTEAALTDLIKAVTAVMDPETLAAILGTHGFAATQSPRQGAEAPISREPKLVAEPTLTDKQKAPLVIEAYGGIDNITSIDACITRLRVYVKDGSKVDKVALKGLGAAGVLTVGQQFQAIFGTHAESIMMEMRDIMAR